MRRCVWAFLIGILLSFSAYSSGHKDPSFDYPFLLGQWFITSDPSEQSQQDFTAIRLTFNSNYTFSIDIQRHDNAIDRWQGEYQVSSDSITLGTQSQSPQSYLYKTTHNKLSLDGMTFNKALSAPLAGVWSSQVISGDDLLASDVQKLDLILQPDFIFMFRSSGTNGQESIKRGIYYIENDYIVLLYENGETQSNYNLENDVLTLSGTGVDMYAELARVQ
ncbi:hypothetical protein A9264_03460 [Vibrio sp. UCD-FRSSP16_10]|uniref:hypothetical protein n=1 Tax=unclassified Vibrio TaxID=2614977 RepID=UPI0007FD500C|nr:hypothetical protein A9260_04910 [Vibrio sp. UCD-FRSSP16_30]OBT20556.1 hypothetical protein A9264_03460 [Vibrio sp. UCD-FRSSP16_10]